MSVELDFLDFGLERYRLAIVRAILDAGQLLVGMQQAVLDSGDVSLKSDGSVVTVADLASEKVIVAAIRTQSPFVFHLVSEELALTTKLDDAVSTWYVDPLDGSRSYAAGSVDYAVLVSEWRNELPVFSVVLYPAIGDLAVASGDAVGWSTANGITEDGGFYNVMHLCYMRSAKVRQFAREIGVNCCEERVESTRALFDVATGRAISAVILLCGHMSWDLAALLHLVVASGGYVSSETGKPVSLSESMVGGRYVIAARDVQVRRALVQMLKDGHED